MKLLSIASPVAAFALVVSFSGTARAGCCDDFWSCAAAVATGGVSCAVQEAVNQINQFVRRVERTRDDGDRRMKDSIRRLDDEAQRGCTAAHEATLAADRTIRQARQRGDAAARAARDVKDAELSQLLRDAGQRLNKNEQDAVKAKQDSAAKLAKAQADRRRLVNTMHQTFQATFIAPLTGLIAPLVAAVDPISAAATIAAAAAALDRIQAETSRVMSRALADLESKAQQDLEALKRDQAAQMQREEESNALASAMEAAAARPTPENKAKLRALLNPGNTGAATQNVRLLAVPVKLMTQPQQQTLPELAQLLKADSAFAAKVKVNVDFDKAKADRTVQGELDKRLANKNEKELRAEEQKLLNEVKARFAKDPKTQQALEKLIRAEIDDRVRRVKAPPKAPAPVVPLKPVKPLKPTG